ncbi:MULTISPECIES: DUF4433 domain-containing protein [Sphingobacterium]|uniref:DUF4433 domain-containing protein n=1 Tax=Sphingobacterium TaxID=28453 RepID=UPI00257E7EB7|nr:MULTISPECIES: DarT ssDNA thymidine ADP-ribosyltransferase family protein [Sphingobacterium]
MNKYFYHFTHIDNLESILKNGLICTNQKQALGIAHYNIANKSIQTRRSTMEIICEDEKSYGYVHDYVPFYFSTRTPMLLSLINQKKVDQPEIIYFGIKTELIRTKELIFSDASANTQQPPNFFKNFDNLSKLNWDIINSRKWGYNENDKHKKMAEVFIKSFDFADVDHIVVFNEYYRNKVIETLKQYDLEKIPSIKYSPVEKNYFYFTKFTTNGKENENLVFGPKFLKYKYDLVNEQVINERKKRNNFNHKNLGILLKELKNNFSYLPETAGIFNLETSNDLHACTVSEHTLHVLKNLHDNVLFKELNEREKNILIFSAYLHDIGKGPHDKWPDRIQPNYPDHPYDSLIQLTRILIEEIEELDNEDIRIITLLVGYHDILGDLSEDRRNTIELTNIITSEKDLELLYILSQADILAIREDWYKNLNANFASIKCKVLGV